MDIYQELLAELGIAQQLVPILTPAEQKKLLTIEQWCPKRCLEGELVLRDGFYTCYECGFVADLLYEWHNPYQKAGVPFGSTNTMNIIRKRFYTSLTHFKEHLRRYMGARFGDLPDKTGATPTDVIAKLRKDKAIDVKSKDCYKMVQASLKRNGHRKFYKEIFMFIYALGGENPKVSHTVYSDAITDYKWLLFRFNRMKSMGLTKRKNMPSLYMVLDLLLRKNGHTPFYTIPYLKDEDLQAQVMGMYSTLDANDDI